MTLLEAHKLALKVLKQVMEEKLDENNVQLAQVRPTGPTWLISGDKGRRVPDSRRRQVEGSDRGYCRVNA
jgi:20S proteasome subunit alpha 5